MPVKDKKLTLFSVAMTNEVALGILPFGTGYFLNEEGQPDSGALGFAMMLQSLSAFGNTFGAQQTYEN